MEVVLWSNIPSFTVRTSMVVEGAFKASSNEVLVASNDDERPLRCIKFFFPSFGVMNFSDLFPIKFSTLNLELGSEDDGLACESNRFIFFGTSKEPVELQPSIFSS